MRKHATLVAVPILMLAAFVSPSRASGSLPAPPPPVVHDAAGHVLDASAYRGSLPEFRERYVSDRSSAEPWLAFTKSGRALTNSIFNPSLTGVAAAQSPTMASDDGGKTWKDVSPTIAGQPAPGDTSNDTMIATDFDTGRVYKGAYSVESGACLMVFFSDDQGESWIPRPLVCDQTTLGTDHPTLFVGKGLNFATATRPPVYGCWDAFDTAGPPDRLGYTLQTKCERSDDGGLTWFQIGNPFTHPPTCAGSLLGVAGFGLGSRIDEDVYMPGGRCGVPTLAISHDNGNHWDDVAIDVNLGMSPEIIDALETQVAEDSAGNLYYAWIAGDAIPRIAVSRTRGRTWSAPITVAMPGTTYTKFASVTAGSAGHVAVTYIGTDVPGGYYASKSDMAAAQWHSYTTMTLDALGANPVFASAQVDPAGDPIRRGDCSLRCIGPDGYTGMYDYLRADVNPLTGAVMSSLVDLCIDGCPDPKAPGGRAAVAVQVGGSGLFGSDVDDGFVADPATPSVSITDPSPAAVAGAATDVSGVATDNQAVARVVVTVTSQFIAGGTYEATCSGCGTPNAKWHAHVLIPPGPDTVTATAYDAAGNRTDSVPIVIVGTSA